MQLLSASQEAAGMVTDTSPTWALTGTHSPWLAWGLDQARAAELLGPPLVSQAGRGRGFQLIPHTTAG